jgi:ABC-type lipopolysaccharide export system ATPase subunit
MLDEPFSHVMPVHIDAIKKMIVRRKAHKGILITDHLYEHIIDICDDLYVINNGKTHLTNSIDDLEIMGYVRKLAGK